MHLNNIISRHIKSLKSRQFFLSFISCLPSFIHFVAKRTQVYLAHGNLCFFSEFFLSQSAFSNMVTFFVRFFVHSLFLSVSSILHFSAVFSSISNRSFNLVRLTNDKCTWRFISYTDSKNSFMIYHFRFPFFLVVGYSSIRCSLTQIISLALSLNFIYFRYFWTDGASWVRYTMAEIYVQNNNGKKTAHVWSKFKELPSL